MIPYLLIICVELLNFFQKTKQDARAALKDVDRNIMNKKLEELKVRNKLDYTADCTELEEQKKKIYDLEEECSMKNEQLQ